MTLPHDVRAGQVPLHFRLLDRGVELVGRDAVDHRVAVALFLLSIEVVTGVQEMSTTWGISCFPFPDAAPHGDPTFRLPFPHLGRDPGQGPSDDLGGGVLA